MSACLLGLSIAQRCAEGTARDGALLALVLGYVSCFAFSWGPVA